MELTLEEVDQELAFWAARRAENRDHDRVDHLLERRGRLVEAKAVVDRVEGL